MIVSFDFDDTLTSPNWTFRNGLWVSKVSLNEVMAAKVHAYDKDGHICVIVTYRSRKYECPRWIAENMPDKVRIEDFLAEYRLPIRDVYFTEHEIKGPVLAKIGASIHYDDDIDAVFSADWHGVHGVHVKVDQWKESV